MRLLFLLLLLAPCAHGQTVVGNSSYDFVATGYTTLFAEDTFAESGTNFAISTTSLETAPSGTDANWSGAVIAPDELLVRDGEARDINGGTGMDGFIELGSLPSAFLVEVPITAEDLSQPSIDVGFCIGGAALGGAWDNGICVTIEGNSGADGGTLQMGTTAIGSTDLGTGTITTALTNRFGDYFITLENDGTTTTATIYTLGDQTTSIGSVSASTPSLSGTGIYLYAENTLNGFIAPLRIYE